MKGIKLDENYKVIINPVKDADGMIMSGEVIDDINYQRCGLIIELNKGEIKEHPTLGFGVQKKLKQANMSKQQFNSELEKELRSDKMLTAKVISTGKNLLEFEVSI